MTTELVIQAFNHAHTSQKPMEGLVLHTDLGYNIQVVSLLNISKSILSNPLAKKGARMIMPVSNPFMQY